MQDKQQTRTPLGNPIKWLFISLLVILGITLGLKVFQTAGSISYFVWGTGDIQIVESSEEITMNEWLGRYQKGDFTKVELVNDTELKGFEQVASGTQAVFFGEDVHTRTFKVAKTTKSALISLLDIGVSLTGENLVLMTYKEGGWFMKFWENGGSLLLILIGSVVIFRFFMSKANPGNMLGISMGKENKQLTVKTRFSDIAGMEEVKNELIEVVDYLKNPEKYEKVGARPPKGVLLYGVPGGGKTLLARAVAGEAGVAFFSASGSEFMEMLVGMGASKVRKLFDQAKAAGRAIIFIDEIDAIGKKRGSGYTGGHQEQEQTLNQILTEMDGFDKNTNIIVMAATNRPDTLDPALLRAGRFDRKIMVTVPTFEERIQIFNYYFLNRKIDQAVNLDSLAKRTSGLVGADIENIVNEAALQVAKDGREALTVADFEYALEKVIMGPEKKIKSMREKEKKLIAYHELGHAVTGHLLEHADPIEKISIVRRGHALGITWTTPEEDKSLYSKAKFLDDLVTLLGGRAAEEIFFWKDEITTGASNDLERATLLAKNMIVKYGMDSDFGTINYFREGEDTEFVRPYSEKWAEMLDDKIKSYLLTAYNKAKEILTENRDLMDKMCAVLLEKEYLSSEEFTAMMKGESIT